MPLNPGTRLGAYEILGPLGAGGMGEVYRARDARLERDVAIKVLPELFAADPDRLARFEREARSVAQLSHPNILGVFDVGTEPSSGHARAGITYTVMELLEGETLRDRLSRSPLGTRRTIEYGGQLARGLAAAHAKGIVHRDLKPDNVFVTADDRVKILDFGLAKPFDLGPADATRAGTATAAGLVMGTVGYMAPEQVRAQATDHRADIFAFGALLYEMLAGRRAFGGDSPADTISAILNSDPPDLDAHVPGLPPALERIVRRCLEKKPELRFQTAQDLAFALDTLSTRTSGIAPADAFAADPPSGAAPARTPRLPWAIAALSLLAAALSWLVAGRAPAAEIPFQMFTPITDAAGVETTPSVSPDGSTVAYAARVNGSWDIHTQPVGGRRSIAVTATADRDESSPAFSADGQRLAWHQSGSPGAIFVAKATGESARRLTDFGVHPAWSPDDRQIAFTTEEIADPYSRLGVSVLWVVELDGGQPRQVDGAGDAAHASWSPSGARLAYWSNNGGQRDIYTIPAAGGERVAVTSDAALDWDPVWSPDGRFLYFTSDRGGAMNLWRIAVDEASGQPRGKPEPVTTGVQAAAAMPSFSADGSRLVFRSSVSATNPVAIPFDPVSHTAGIPVVLSNSNVMRRPNDISRDGRWLAFANLGEPQEDLFISAVDGSGMRRVTDDPARDRIPMWSPDGRSLYFYSNRDGEWAIWSIGIDGGGLRRLVARTGGLLYPQVSPSGDRLVMSGTAGTDGVLITGSKNGAPDETVTLLPNSARYTATSWSPDGSKLAGYLIDAANRPEALAIYHLAARTITSRFDVSALYVRWLPDSRHVVYFTMAGDRLMVLDTVTGSNRAVDVQLPLLDAAEAFAVAPDGRQIVHGGRREEADIWIVERQPPR